MSEFRQNPVTKQWILLAPVRAKRPEDFRTHSVMHGMPEEDPECVFCPVNDAKNAELLRFPEKGDWQIRVIQNKFEALEHTKVYRHRDFYNSRSGYGNHEVIITRKHNEPVALQSIATVEMTLGVFRDRIKELHQDPSIAYVQVFHNHGRDAGASIIHPHHQIIATPIIPPHIHSEILGAYHHFDTHKQCIYCDIMKEELENRDRIVYESEEFVVMSPYAPRKPFEMWIIPKKHNARFEDISPSQLKHLSFVLKVTLGQLYTKLSDPPLNFYIHTMPAIRDVHTKHEEAAYHWHLIVFPRLTIWAGFEYATGVPINPMPPEEAAKFLRE